MKYMKVVYKTYPCGYEVEIVTAEKAALYPMFDDTQLLLPATEAEYQAYQRQLADDIRPYGCRMVVDYYDTMFGDRIAVGECYKPNRHQQKHIAASDKVFIAFWTEFEDGL